MVWREIVYNMSVSSLFKIFLLLLDSEILLIKMANISDKVRGLILLISLKTLLYT